MQNELSSATQSWGSAIWARVFAGVYDPVLWVGERAGLRAQREELISRARGFTLEIGGGTGLNLPYYPDSIGELVLAEPDASMRRRLERRLRRSGRPAQLLDSPAEQLPFAAGSVDTVVSTFVLCTVDAPDEVLREVIRVLRPDGQLLFIEHVRSDSPTLARWQDRLVTPWRCFARGCRCNRATAELMVSFGLRLDAVVETSWHAMPPIVRPLVIGRARMRADVTDAGSLVVDHDTHCRSKTVGQ
ncbi:MAG: class I SAM-dependent methyltransferase [Ilumatobacteraceae bacterium]